MYDSSSILKVIYFINKFIFYIQYEQALYETLKCHITKSKYKEQVLFQKESLTFLFCLLFLFKYVQSKYIYIKIIFEIFITIAFSSDPKRTSFKT